MENYKVISYPDGATYVDVYTDKPIIFRINNNGDLHILAQYVDAYVNKWGKEPTITIPNLFAAQEDRRFKKGQSSGLKLVLRHLNSLPVKKYRIFHPHNAEAVEMAMPNVEIISNTEFIQDVLSDLESKYYESEVYQSVHNTTERLILMSSDAGGMKPLGKTATEIDWSGLVMNCSKVRKGGIVTRQQAPMEDFGGNDILIIDDIFVYGGTFKGIAKLLKSKNCGKLFLACSHGTVSNLGEDSLDLYFDEIYVTNSKFSLYSATTKSDQLPESVLDEYVPGNIHVLGLF